MRHLLLSKGLWGIIDGTDTLPENATAAATNEHSKRSQKTFSSIVMAVGMSQLYLITLTESPAEAWDTLRKHFERETLSNKLFLKKQYFRSEMKDSTSVEAHLKHMKEIADRLAAIGAHIAEEDQVVTLLGSLPRSYSTLVTALEARGDDLTLSFVKQALVQEEQKRVGIKPSNIISIHRLCHLSIKPVSAIKLRLCRPLPLVAGRLAHPPPRTTRIDPCPDGRRQTSETPCHQPTEAPATHPQDTDTS